MTIFAAQPCGASKGAIRTRPFASSSSASRSREHALTTGAMATQPIVAERAPRLSRRARIGVGAQPLLGGEIVRPLADEREFGALDTQRRRFAGGRDGEVEGRLGAAAPNSPISRKGTAVRRIGALRQSTAESSASVRKKMAEGAKLRTGRPAPGAAR